jgi:hypothetical protein
MWPHLSAASPPMFWSRAMRQPTSTTSAAPGLVSASRRSRSSTAPLLLLPHGAVQGPPPPPSFHHRGTLLIHWSPPEPPIRRFSPPREDRPPKHFPSTSPCLLSKPHHRRAISADEIRVSTTILPLLLWAPPVLVLPPFGGHSLTPLCPFVSQDLANTAIDRRSRRRSWNIVVLPPPRRWPSSLVRFSGNHHAWHTPRVSLFDLLPPRRVGATETSSLATPPRQPRARWLRPTSARLWHGPAEPFWLLGQVDGNRAWADLSPLLCDRLNFFSNCFN